ncbi:helix-turn-helix domain-containing protein [Candidatus Parabeggiatoa sp. HSG14]|uniref:helix-turn-helix domain-containing protein n=1 Tax=Candidatus Parabeggiatoa sp. HSG14 TaxID=3055593 RepID=UPI0025A909A4|nr:helix-turn-helix domain-containing protein [Thiotrichales bacterium HSG14]
MMDDFAKWLDKEMKKVGMSDEALAEQIGVSKMTVYNWRSGKIKRPSKQDKLLSCTNVLEFTPKQRVAFLKAAGHVIKNDGPLQPPIPVVGVPIIQPYQFFGRENLLSNIYWAWNKTIPESILIVGEKRSGKTSLLNYLKNISQATYLRPEQPKGWPNNWLPRNFQFAFVDFQEANMSKPETLIKDVLRQLHLEIPKVCDLACFSSILKQSIKKTIIILMDNLDVGLLAPTLDTSFWGNMCALGSSGILSFVVTISEPLDKLACNCDKILSFLSIFGHTLHLDALTEGEARELIGNSPKLFSAKEIEKMLKESGYWAAPLQVLCDRRLQALLLKRV